MKRNGTILMILLLIAGIHAVGQEYIDKVCIGAERRYRINGEPGSSYSWMLTDIAGMSVPLANSAGTLFTDTDPITGAPIQGSEVTITWHQSGIYKLAAVQNSIFGCDTIEQGDVEVFEMPTAIAGNPLSICSDMNVELSNSTATHYSTLLWTTSGDGYFEDPLILHSRYIVGASDLITGNVNLTLTAQGLGNSPTCIPASSTLLITFRNIPKMVITDPPSVCSPQTIDLSAVPVTAGSDPDLDFEYFSDKYGSVLLANYKTISSNGTYYIRGTSRINGCSVLDSVNVIFNKSIVPSFATIQQLCLNSIPPELPNSSYNGISGSWIPATISTAMLGKTAYKFVPDAGQCATDTTIVIEITDQITPIFSFGTTFCQNSAVPDLPAISSNGISGTWTPSAIATGMTGKSTYTFTPDAGQCSAPTAIEITITDLFSPTFSIATTLCLNSTPPQLPFYSIEGFVGEWQPATISTAFLGTSLYTFIPQSGQCARSYTIAISVEPQLVPQFDAIAPLCFGSSFVLPATSKNGISGTWNPSVVNTNTAGKSTYQFMPDANWCAQSASVEIEVYEPVTVQAKADPLLIYGGTTKVTVTASGGSGNYTSGTGIFDRGTGTYTFTVTDDAGCSGSKTIFISEPQDFTVLATLTNPAKCAGGLNRVVISVQGGTRPYTYSYSGGNPSFVKVNDSTFLVSASPVAYQFKVFDTNGLFGQADEFFVSDPPALTLLVSSTSPTCFGGADGTATVTASQGVPPYTYQWNDPMGQTTATATGLKAGQYLVTVTDQCGPKTETVTVTDPPEIFLSAVGIDSPCNGTIGSIGLSTTNAPDGLYDILHDSGSFTNIQVTGNKAIFAAPVGTYNNLKLSKNGCTTADGVVASVGSAPALNVIEFVVQPTCRLTSGTIAVTSPQQGTGFVYSIDNKPWQASATFTGLAPGTYQIKAKGLASGCESEPKTIVILPVPPAPATPIASVTFQPNCSITTGVIIVTSPAQATGFEFSIDNKSWQISSIFTGLSSGTHQVKVREIATGCESEPITLMVNPLLDVPDAPVASVTIQPDCAILTGTIVVTTPKEGTGFGYSIDGAAFQASATFASLAPGTHILKVRDMATGCESGNTTLTVNPVPETPAAPTASVTVQPNCTILTGTIVVTSPAQGTGFQYSIDGGAYQASATFTGLAPGPHQLKVKNMVTGCESGTTTLTVDPLPQPLPAPVAAMTVQPTCTLPTGTIVVTSPAPGTGFQYSIDGGAYQASATFTKLVPGLHRIKVKNLATGCESEITSINVEPDIRVPETPIASVTSHPGCLILTGIIVVNSPLEGTGYEYSIDGGAYQASDTFLGLSPGIHRIRVKDLTFGCESPVITLTVNPVQLPPAAPTARVSKEPTCNDPNGVVIVTSPRQGTGFEYSIDGTTYQDSATFANLTSGDYYIRVRKKGTDCESPDTKINVKAIPPAPILTASAQNSKCYGEPGIISITVTNTANGVYTIKYDGGEFRNVNVTNGKATIAAPARTYTNLNIDANGCNSYDPKNIVTITVSQPSEIIITETITEIDLKTKRKGAIDLHVSGGTGSLSFLWSNNATTEDIKDLSDGSYTVTVTDENGCTKQKLLSVPVPNYPPVAVADTFMTGCNVVSGYLLLNDSDPEGDPFFLGQVVVVNVLHGTVTLNPADGSFSYVADAGFAGRDSFQYAIFDANQYQSSKATVTIIIYADADHDGIANEKDPDADGDGILNVAEGGLTADNDGDGIPNYLDIDSDNDGIVDVAEAQTWAGIVLPLYRDADSDGIDDAFDPDQNGVSIVPIDTDSDGIPDFLDSDSDDDGVPDYIEGHDLKAIGKPAHIATGKDSDADGLDDGFDIVVNSCDASGNITGSNAEMQDFNNDGKPDWRDDNDDGDKYPTKYEDLNADGNWANDDINFDGHPEYLDYGRECDMFIPDAFSPNNDNIHDYFQIYCLQAFPNAKMYIFDQLGNKIFERENYGNLEVWDTPDRAWWTGKQELGPGRSRGEMVPPGTYFYVLDLGNKELKKSFVFVSY